MSHDRTGERIDDEDEEQEALLPLPAQTGGNGPCPDRRCRKGWIAYLETDHPVPCPRCKPHLVRTERIRRMGLGEKK